MAILDFSGTTVADTIGTQTQGTAATLGARTSGCNIKAEKGDECDQGVKTAQHRGRRPSKRDIDEMMSTAPLVEEGNNEGSESEEEDVLLFDSLPERATLLDDGHRFQAARPEIVQRGLDACADERKRKAESRTPSQQSLAVSAVTASLEPTTRLAIGPITIPLRPRKRVRTDEWEPIKNAAGNDSECSYSGETDREEPDAVMVNVTKGPLLACPFNRLDPVLHASCARSLELRDVRTVKQHVIVDHRLAPYCPTCFEAFSSAAERNEHILERQCDEKERPDGWELRGVSDDQVEVLAARSSERKKRVGKKGGKKGRNGKKEIAKPVRLSEEDKWFAVWDVLFPGLPRPELAYMSSPAEKDLGRMRRFWQSKGPELVAGVLESRGLLRWEDNPDEEAALSALHATALADMMESCFGGDGGLGSVHSNDNTMDAAEASQPADGAMDV